MLQPSASICCAGTHYQFLWYMARVFLPGRRQLCKLSALVQPSHYADILTQKVTYALPAGCCCCLYTNPLCLYFQELRNFAISLFGKN